MEDMMYQVHFCQMELGRGKEEGRKEGRKERKTGPLILESRQPKFDSLVAALPACGVRPPSSL